MINWPDTLNTTVLILEIASAACLLGISFRAKDVKVYAFAGMAILMAGLAFSSKMAHALHSPTAPITAINEVVLHISMIINLVIFALLMRKKAFRNIAVVFALVAVAAWLQAIAFDLSGRPNAGTYMEQLPQLLLLVSSLMFIWERLSIHYIPNRKDDFWLWVSIALLFDIVTSVPFSVLFNYLTIHYKEFSHTQIVRISNLKYLTSCVQYLLLIRACYEYR